MVLLRQNPKSLLIFPPKILNVFESVPVAEHLPNIIRATNFIEQSVLKLVDKEEQIDGFHLKQVLELE